MVLRVLQSSGTTGTQLTPSDLTIIHSIASDGTTGSLDTPASMTRSESLGEYWPRAVVPKPDSGQLYPRISRGWANEGVDIVIIGDSWPAFCLHRGTTQSAVTFSNGAFIDSLNIVNIYLYNAPSGMTVSGDSGAPTIVAGKNMQGREGFTSVTGKGLLADALVDLGVNINRINIWQYACGGTTAGHGPSHNMISTGAWDQDVPSTISSVGGLYGCTGGDLTGLGGWQADTNRKSAWLQPQKWLEGTSSPYKNYTVCDMIAHPPTGKVIVIVCLGGNDIVDATKHHPFIDHYTGEWDPDGALETRWDEIASPTGDGGSFRAISEGIYALNPDAEVVVPSYLTFICDDPDLPNPNIKLPTNYAPGSPVDGPIDWIAYSGDGSNPNPDPDYDTPYHSPYTLPSVYWPLGANGVTLPATWTSSSLGFHRLYHTWGMFTGQRDLGGYPFLRDWVGHWIADNYAWQKAGTTAAPGPTTGFPTYSYNWTWTNNSAYYIGSFPTGIAVSNRHWNTAYSAIHSAYGGNSSGFNTTIGNRLLVQQSPLNMYQIATILGKDVTTANTARIFRDGQRPRMAAAENYWIGTRGKNFIWLDLYEEIPVDLSGCSQDDPYANRCLPKEDWVDLHPSSSGAPKWAALIAKNLLRRTTLLRSLRESYWAA